MWLCNMYVATVLEDLCDLKMQLSNFVSSKLHIGELQTLLPIASHRFAYMSYACLRLPHEVQEMLAGYCWSLHMHCDID